MKKRPLVSYTVVERFVCLNLIVKELVMEVKAKNAQYSLGEEKVDHAGRNTALFSLIATW